jgi:hypothetical protein
MGMVVRVSKPPLSIIRGRSVYYVASKFDHFNYRGPVPVWVANEVRKGNQFFVVRPTHDMPEFLSLAAKEQHF